MFNLISFAGSWWKMAYRDSQTGFIGKFLQLYFPESNSCSIATTAISGNKQMAAFG
jgi:hypothetical protein